MVCDDDPMNTWCLNEMLSSLNYKCKVVNNGHDCIKELHAFFTLIMTQRFHCFISKLMGLSELNVQIIFRCTNL